MTLLESDKTKYLFNSSPRDNWWFYASLLIRKGVTQGSWGNYTASSLIPFEEKIEREVIETRKRSVFLSAIYRISRSFHFESTEVEKFLSKHPEVLTPILEANKEIRRIFSNDVDDLCLNLERDPEEDFESLFIIIKTKLSPEEAVELLDRFDEEWWFDIDNEIKRILKVDIEVVSKT